MRTTIKNTWSGGFGYFGAENATEIALPLLQK
jgi:hypothetical protein